MLAHLPNAGVRRSTSNELIAEASTLPEEARGAPG